MKITKAKLKQIIKEELSVVLKEQDDWYSEEHETLADKKFAERGTTLSSAEFGTEEENRALDRRQQKEYAMALSTVLGISTEEVESMSPLEISELGTSIRNHYRNKLNKRPPPLADPHRTGKYTPREG